MDISAYVFLFLFAALYLLPIIVVIMKKERNQKVHALWYVAIAVLNIILFTIFSFSTGDNTIRVR